MPPPLYSCESCGFSDLFGCHASNRTSKKGLLKDQRLHFSRRVKRSQASKWPAHKQMRMWGNKHGDIGSSCVATCLVQIFFLPQMKNSPAANSDLIPRLQPWAVCTTCGGTCAHWPTDSVSRTAAVFDWHQTPLTLSTSSI